MLGNLDYLIQYRKTLVIYRYIVIRIIFGNAVCETNKWVVTRWTVRLGRLTEQGAYVRRELKLTAIIKF